MANQVHPSQLEMTEAGANLSKSLISLKYNEEAKVSATSIGICVSSFARMSCQQRRLFSEFGIMDIAN